MMMYRMALYFAIISALTGAIGGVMEMNIANGDTNWFPATNIHPIDNNTIFTDDQIQSMQDQNAISEDASTDSGSYNFGILGIIQIMWSMGKGVLMIYPELNKVLYIDDGNGNNAFQPFLFLIQIGIWAIYLVGIAQVYRNANYKYNY